MKKIIKYTDEPLGSLNIVTDFLPSPKDLIFKDDTVKVTISLTKESIEFFKKEAEKHHTQYQKMIRNLLDVYASAHLKAV
jgi:predicted DNA binding CopG/RHH family protein